MPRTRTGSGGAVTIEQSPELGNLSTSFINRSGTLSLSSNPDDWFIFTLTDRATVDFDFTGTNYQVSIYDYDTNQLITSVSASQLNLINLESGKYKLKIDSTSTGNINYSFGVKVSTWLPTDFYSNLGASPNISSWYEGQVEVIGGRDTQDIITFSTAIADQFEFSISPEKGKSLSVQLLNSLGQVIRTPQLTNDVYDSGIYTFTWDLAAGNYSIKVTSNETIGFDYNFALNAESTAIDNWSLYYGEFDNLDNNQSYEGKVNPLLQYQTGWYRFEGNGSTLSDLGTSAIYEDISAYNAYHEYQFVVTEAEAGVKEVAFRLYDEAWVDAIVKNSAGQVLYRPELHHNGKYQHFTWDLQADTYTVEVRNLNPELSTLNYSGYDLYLYSDGDIQNESYNLSHASTWNYDKGTQVFSDADYYNLSLTPFSPESLYYWNNGTPPSSRAVQILGTDYDNGYNSIGFKDYSFTEINSFVFNPAYDSTGQFNYSLVDDSGIIWQGTIEAGTTTQEFDTFLVNPGDYRLIYSFDNLSQVDRGENLNIYQHSNAYNRAFGTLGESKITLTDNVNRTQPWDVFSFTVSAQNAGRGVEIINSNSTIAMDYYLYNATTNNRLAVNNTGYFAGLGAGNYEVHAKANINNSTFAYSNLSYNLSAGIYLTNFEKSTKFNVSDTALISSSTINGNKYYGFTLTQEDFIVFNINMTGVADFSLYDASDNLIELKSLSYQTGKLFEHLDAGNYYLKVWSWTNAYSFTIDTFKDNYLKYPTNSITPGQNPVNGTIDQELLFQVTIATDGYYDFRLNYDSSLTDLDVNIYNSSFVLLGDSNIRSNSEESTVYLTAGTYLYDIEEVIDGGNVAYSVQVESNYFLNANAIATGDNVSGTKTTNNYYTFTLTQNEVVSFNVASSHSSDFKIYDSNEVTIHSEQVQNGVVRKDLQAGSYFFSVSNAYLVSNYSYSIATSSSIYNDEFGSYSTFNPNTDTKETIAPNDTDLFSLNYDGGSLAIHIVDSDATLNLTLKDSIGNIVAQQNNVFARDYNWYHNSLATSDTNLTLEITSSNLGSYGIASFNNVDTLLHPNGIIADIDPNNLQVNPNAVITGNNAYFNEFIDEWDSYDSYLFTPSSTGRYSYLASPNNGNAFRLKITDNITFQTIMSVTNTNGFINLVAGNPYLVSIENNESGSYLIDSSIYSKYYAELGITNTE